MEIKVVSRSTEETVELGENLGKVLKPPLLIALYGDLGTGKTTFLKGVARGLGIKKIRSPSFTMITRYRGKYPVTHIDLYRLEDAEELIPLGLKDAIYDEESIIFVEWAERMMYLLPEERIEVKITHLDETTRELLLKPLGNRAESFLKLLLDSLEGRWNPEVV